MEASKLPELNKKYRYISTKEGVDTFDFKIVEKIKSKKGNKQGKYIILINSEMLATITEQEIIKNIKNIKSIKEVEV